MLPPIVFLVNSSLHTTNPDGSFKAFTFRYYVDLVADPRFGRNLLNTTIYAIGATSVAIFLGTLQAWIVERTNTPLRKYVFLVSIMSLGIPSVLYTIAFLLLLGKTGPVNQFFEAVTGIHQAVNVYSLGGMIVIEGIDFSPLVFLLLAAVFRASGRLVRGSRHHERRRNFSDISADYLQARDTGGRRALHSDLHARVRIVRDAGARRPAGQYRLADHRHLSVGRGSEPAQLRPGGGVLRGFDDHRRASCSPSTTDSRGMPKGSRRSPARAFGRAC